MTTPTEQILTEVLDTWALKGHGLALQQIKTLLFMQLLREAGFEIVKAVDLQKIRYQQKTLIVEITNLQRQVIAMKMRVDALNNLDIVQEIPLDKDTQKENPPKANPRQPKNQQPT